MSKSELMEIYQQIDNRLKKYKAEYRTYAKSKGYTHFSEYLHCTYKKKTAVEIVDDMIKDGVKPPPMSTIWQTQHRVKELMVDKVPLQPEDKICNQCGYRKVAKGNHATCRQCDPRNRKIIFDDTFYSGGTQYLHTY